VKRKLSYIFPAVMLLLYMAAGVGYGVHTCKGEGITSVSILVKESGCEGHSHSMDKQCCKDSCCDAKSGGCHTSEESAKGCCDTELHQLADGYEVAKQLSNIQMSLIPLPAGILASADIISDKSLAGSYLNLDEGDPPGHYTKEYLSYISVWRL